MSAAASTDFAFADSAMRAAAEGFALAPLQLPAPGEAERRFRFGEDFLGFQGHFPNYPILPAFVQVLLAQMVAESLAGRPASLAAISKAKFVSEVRPGQEVLVRCKERESAPAHSVETQVFADGVLSASFLLRLAGSGS